MGRKNRKKQDFGKKDIQDDIGTAYEQKVLLNPDREDCIYDDFELASKNKDDRLIEYVSKKIHSKRASKVTELSLNLESDEDKPRKRRRKRSHKKKAESSSEDEESEDKESDPDEWSLEKNFMKQAKDEDVDTRAWGKDKSVFFGSNVSDHLSRKRASNLHVEENFEAQELELEATKDYQIKMKESAKIDLIQESSSDEEEPKLNTITSNSHLTKEQKILQFNQNWPDVKPLVLKAEAVYHGKDGRDMYYELLKNKHLFNGNHQEFIKWCMEKYKIYTHFYYYVQLYLIFIDSPHEITPKQIREHDLMDKIKYMKRCVMYLEQWDECFVPQVKMFIERVRTGQPLMIRPDSEKTGAVTTAKFVKETTAKSVKETTAKSVTFSADTANGEDDSKVPVESNPLVPVESKNSEDSYAEMQNNERRPITKFIQENKGLIVKRDRKTKIPRTKYRARYEKKMKARKGQVQDIRKLTSAYTGEASGINIKAVKSRKFR